eukprot:167057-Rhodomonas_salina.1
MNEGYENGKGQGAEEFSEEEEEERGRLLHVEIQNTCFGRNDFLNVTLDSDELVKDFKKQLFLLNSRTVCDPEQMELWWRGVELHGLAHETFRSHACSMSGADPVFLTPGPVLTQRFSLPVTTGWGALYRTRGQKEESTLWAMGTGST